MKTCKDCKYWYNLWENDNCGYCDKITDGNNKYDICRVYSSVPITTEKNFGCIHWKEK
jgi:hypothetical protein